MMMDFEAIEKYWFGEPSKTAPTAALKPEEPSAEIVTLTEPLKDLPAVGLDENYWWGDLN